jgi:hypothetical protein
VNVTEVRTLLLVLFLWVAFGLMAVIPFPGTVRRSEAPSLVFMLGAACLLGPVLFVYCIIVGLRRGDSR